MRADTPTGMKSIISKELRENYRWAVLGFLGMLVAMGTALELDFRELWITSRNLQSLISEEFQAVMVLGCPVLGLALGILQVAFESRGERFSLLVHRPVSRSAIFAAKVIAGAVLYLSATAGPFLLAAWWVATPGHVPAPFAASMMVPGALDIVLGFAYYFAGILTVMREARWYASRGVGLAVAALCTLVSLAAESGAIAVVAAVAGLAVLAPAAWGAFVAGGAYAAQPRLARAALAVVVLTGVGSVAILGCVGVHEVARELGMVSRFGSWLLPYPGGYVITTEGSVQHDRTGDQVELEFVELKNHRRSMRENYFRLHGRFVPVHGFVHRTWTFDEAEGVVYEYGPSRWTSEYIEFGGYVEPSTLVPEPEKPETRLDYVGAWESSWAYWGYDRARFLASDPTLLVFAEVVYEADRQSARALFAAPEGDRILGGRLLHARGGTPTFGHAIIATRKAAFVLDPAGEVILRTPMVPRPETLDRVGVAPIEGDRFAVYFVPMPIVDGAPPREEVIRIVSASGEVLEEHELEPRLGRVGGSPPSSDFAGPVLPLPAMVFAAVERSYDIHPRRYSVLARWYLYLLFALVPAICAFVLTRRHAFSAGRVILWTAMSFVFGAVGFFTLLCLESWPSREECASCGRSRIVNRDACERCGAEWPAPAPDGTEIFEPV